MQRHERRLAVTLLVAAAVLALNGVWAGNALRTLITDAGWYSHTNEVIAQTEGLRSTIAESTAAVRGYLLSGQDPYLRSYSAAVERYHRASATVQQLTVDNPSQERRIALLNQAMGVRLALAADAIAARQQEGFEAGRRIMVSRANDTAVAQVGDLLQAL